MCNIDLSIVCIQFIHWKFPFAQIVTYPLLGILILRHQWNHSKVFDVSKSVKIVGWLPCITHPMQSKCLPGAAAAKRLLPSGSEDLTARDREVCQAGHQPPDLLSLSHEHFPQVEINYSCTALTKCSM